MNFEMSLAAAAAVCVCVVYSIVAMLLDNASVAVETKSKWHEKDLKLDYCHLMLVALTHCGIATFATGNVPCASLLFMCVCGRGRERDQWNSDTHMATP